MSWSLTKSEIPAEDIRVELEAAADAYETNSPAGYSEEVQEQIDAGIEAAENLASCVGGEKVSVTLSGHANPEHKPNPFYGNDHISVYISNMDPKPDPEAPKVDDEAAGAADAAAEEPGA